MRAKRANDFFVEVPDIGTFRFGRRTYGDRLKIRAAFLALTKEMGEQDEELAGMASIVSAYGVMCVECPHGWENIAELDMTEDPDIEDKILGVYGAWRAKEDSFRKAKDPDQGGEAGSAQPAQDDRVLVPEQVQPQST